MKIKSGWAMDREKFSEHARAVFDVAIAHRRANVSLPGEVPQNQRFGGSGGETLRGARFKDDTAVIARLESMFTEVEFLADVAGRIDYALTDAARSDHWYEFEKDYGGPEVEDVHEDDEEEDGRD